MLKGIVLDLFFAAAPSAALAAIAFARASVSPELLLATAPILAVPLIVIVPALAGRRRRARRAVPA